MYKINFHNYLNFLNRYVKEWYLYMDDANTQWYYIVFLLSTSMGMLTTWMFFRRSGERSGPDHLIRWLRGF